MKELVDKVTKLQGVNSRFFFIWKIQKMDFLKFYLFERLEFCGDDDYCRMSDNLAYAQWRASPFNNDDRENWVTETIGRTVFGSKCEYVLGSF